MLCRECEEGAREKEKRRRKRGEREAEAAAVSNEYPRGKAGKSDSFY